MRSEEPLCAPVLLAATSTPAGKDAVMAKPLHALVNTHAQLFPPLIIQFKSIQALLALTKHVVIGTKGEAMGLTSGTIALHGCS